MDRPEDLKTLAGMRVVDRPTRRHGRIRSYRSYPTATGERVEAIVCFDGGSEPLGNIGDYYNLKDLDQEEEQQ